MKTTTIEIALTSAQSEFVRRTVARDFASPNEFFRDLLRERMKRETAADLEFLKSTQHAAASEPTEDEMQEIVQTQKRLRRERAGK